MAIDYKALVKDAFETLEDLMGKRDEIEFQIAKTYQLLRAAIPMLPEKEKDRLEQAFIDRVVSRGVGLTEAIRNVLRACPDKALTAIEVREELKRSGFDFSGYSTNPLASIHTVLKRFKPEEVETTNIDGATAYRWKVSPLAVLMELLSAKPTAGEKKEPVLAPPAPPPLAPKLPLGTLRDALLKATETKKKAGKQ